MDRVALGLNSFPLDAGLVVSIGRSGLGCRVAALLVRVPATVILVPAVSVGTLLWCCWATGERSQGEDSTKE